MPSQRDLGSLFVELRLNSAQFSSALRNAREELGLFGKRTAEMRRDLQGVRAGLGILAAGFGLLDGELGKLAVSTGAFATALSLLIPQLGLLRLLVAGFGLALAANFRGLKDWIAGLRGSNDELAKLKERIQGLKTIGTTLESTAEQIRKLHAELRIAKGESSEFAEALRELDEARRAGGVVQPLGERVIELQRQKSIVEAFKDILIQARLFRPSEFIGSATLRAIAAAREDIDEIGQSRFGRPFAEFQSRFRFAGPTSGTAVRVDDQALQEERKQTAIGERIVKLIEELKRLGVQFPLLNANPINMLP